MKLCEVFNVMCHMGWNLKVGSTVYMHLYDFCEWYIHFLNNQIQLEKTSAEYYKFFLINYISHVDESTIFNLVIRKMIILVNNKWICDYSYMQIMKEIESPS